MRCADALAVHLLGPAATPEEQREAAVHIARCPSCAGTVDDLEHDGVDAEGSLEALDHTRPAPRPWIRVALGALSMLELCLALPWMVGLNPLALLDENVGAEHLTRDGAIGLFVGAAGLLAALRPRYAVPAVVVATIGVFTQVIAGAVDEQAHHVAGWFELLHLLTLGILLFTALIAGSRATGPGPPHRAPGLRVTS